MLTKTTRYIGRLYIFISNSKNRLDGYYTNEKILYE